MKAILFAATAMLAATGSASADETVNGYVHRDGTYVQPYHRTNPDNSRTNNYGTQGNVNPYTGQAGTVNPYAPPRQPSYGMPQTNNSGQYPYRY